MWHNRGIKISLSFFFVLFIADFITTVLNWELIPFLESNPIYKLVGLPGIFLLNLVIIAGAFWYYKRTKHTTNRFAIINGILIICFIRFFVILNNIRVLRNPPPIEVAMQVTEAMKQAYLLEMIAPAFLPYFLGYAAFYLFTLDHNIGARI